MIVLGWIIGVLIGVVPALSVVLALALPIPTALATLIAALPIAVASIGFGAAVLFIVLAYITAYTIGTLSIAPGLPAGTTFPLPVPVAVGAPTVIASGTGELFARGVMLGLSATVNLIVLACLPPGNWIIASWAFQIISLGIITAVRTNLVYQGFLGWSAWLFPVSWFATFIGLLLFLINAPFAFAAGGMGAFRMDFTTGVMETNGGIVGITGFVGGGFSLGNFNFISPAPGVGPTSFTAPGLSTHETGHSLNTASMGGVVLWINAVDENIPPFAKRNLAYGELCAESHAQAMPAPPVRNDFFILMWV